MAASAAPPSVPVVARPGTSLYYQVYLDLKHRLAQGEFAPGSPIPSETVLAGHFGVGRVTVRRAILDMVAEGLLVRYRARGTFVAESRAKGAAGVSVGEQLRAIAEDTSVAVVEFGGIAANAAVAGKLGLDVGSKVQFARRLRARDGAPVFLLDSYLPWSVGRAIRKRDLASKPLHRCLADQGVELAGFTQEFSAFSAPPNVAGLLDVPVGSALGMVERVSTDRGGTPVEFLISAFAPDRARFRLSAADGQDGDAGSFVYRS